MKNMFTTEIHCSGAEQWFSFEENNCSRSPSDWLDHFSMQTFDNYMKIKNRLIEVKHVNYYLQT